LLSIDNNNNNNNNNNTIMAQTATETPTKKNIDENSEDLLTRELNQLSFKDRNDYHGK
jgi:hypothetical protein